MRDGLQRAQANWNGTLGNRRKETHEGEKIQERAAHISSSCRGLGRRAPLPQGAEAAASAPARTSPCPPLRFRPAGSAHSRVVCPSVTRSAGPFATCVAGCVGRRRRADGSGRSFSAAQEPFSDRGTQHLRSRCAGGNPPMPCQARPALAASAPVTASSTSSTQGPEPPTYLQAIHEYMQGRADVPARALRTRPPPAAPPPATGCSLALAAAPPPLLQGGQAQTHWG